MGNILMFPIDAVSAVKDKGVHYWLVYWYSYLYLIFAGRLREPRFPKYDICLDGQPEKQGFYIPKQEEELEQPKTNLKSEECDSAYCFGVNSKSECLSVRLTHVSESVVSCSLFLRLSDGRAYCLPEEHVDQVRTDEPDTFGSSRFKMQCLTPMRKWRIFFNGTLREAKPIEDDSRPSYRHVRITLLFNPSAGEFDFTSPHQISKKNLSEAVANSTSILEMNPKSIFDNIIGHLNAYEHPGMLFGTYTIDNEQEQEIYLWGSRGHYMGALRNESSKEAMEFPWKFYAQLENGILIQIGEKRIPSGPVSRITYGYVMRQNAFIYPVDSCQVLSRSEGETRIICTTEYSRYSIIAEIQKNPFCGFSSNPSTAQNIRQVNVTVNGTSGKGLLFLGREIQKSKNDCKKGFPTDISYTRDLSTKLWDSANSSSCLSGGKGSSLYHLYSDKQGYDVPKGVIVTTNGYQEFMKNDLRNIVEELEKNAPFLSPQDLSAECEKVVNAVKEAKLPESVRNSVASNLKVTFKENMNYIKFAVRSSATGEDTEQMSAAGQMDTFLGVQGLEQIFDAIRKCWASQFAFVAVQYKRQYGQKLNTPMAVVIQEMVPCDVAGVAFSCDPLTGDPTFPSITANYGLGESVVSATAEPDTVVLRRDVKNGIFVHSRQIGSKKIKIIMDETSGVREVELNEDESRECCISDEMALRLGKIVVELEKKFGNPRDIEWGIKNDEIFLLQCRPVTSIDTETDFEIRHFDDTFLRTECEYLTTANVGEVMPGAASPVGLDLVVLLNNYTMAKHKFLNAEEMPDSPYFTRSFGTVNSHLLLCILDGFFKFSQADEDGNSSDEANSLSLSIFGRIVDDPKMISMSKDRHATDHKVGGLKHSIKSLVGKVYVFVIMFFAGKFTEKAAKIVDKVQFTAKKGSTSSEILDVIAKNYSKICTAFISHYDASIASSSWNHAAISVLVKENKGVWNNAVFSDVGYLLSKLTNVESADVPSAIQALSFAIAQSVNKEEFSNMNLEDALNWLQSTQSDAGKMFRQFLENHGHRCLREFDLYSKPWGTDPKPLVKMLQENVTKDIKDVTGNKTLSYSELFSEMSIKIGFFSKMLLRFILPNCRRGVRGREINKSLLIKTFDKFRKLFTLMVDAMVAEGRIPNADLVYFLSVFDIKKLIETRSPRLVARAFRRWKCHSELDKLIFPEIMSGIPKPINMEEETETEDGFTMTGVPVSRGVVKATARVVMNLEEAKNIQSGDVLITYSTDIGWSPYFPLLSGVVTELGGLISHGAVVAREYGLPCVVNLHGATRAFKSGDLVLLNGTEGFLKKLKSA